MQEKSIAIGTLRIAYIENNPGASKTIFFIHGNSCSSRMWRKQIQCELFNSYRLIAFDLPGHGKSFVSENPFDDYSPIGTAKILSSAINLLAGTNPYIVVGFSYGTNLVAEMLAHQLKPAGIILVSSCVIGKNHGLDKIFIPKEPRSIFFYNETDKKVVYESMSASLTSVNKNDIQNLVEDYLIVCPNFKSALFKSVADGKISDEILLLQSLTTQIPLIFGKDDDLVNIHYLDDNPFNLWRDQVYKLPGASHWVNIDMPEIFNQIVAEYAQQVFIQDHV